MGRCVSIDEGDNYGATSSWPYKESVTHPKHYGGKDDPYEAIKVIHAWSLSFNLGNAVKYICRAGKKDKGKLLEDLKKARFYINYEINRLGGKETTE